MKKTISKYLAMKDLAIIIAVGTGILLLAACGSGSDNSHQDTRSSVQILDEVRVVKAIGKVIPAEDWAVISSPVPARIQEIAVREGDTVQAGQMILLLESGNSTLAVSEARAQLAVLEAERRAGEDELRKARIYADELENIFKTSRRLLEQGAETREKTDKDSSAWRQQMQVVRGLERQVESRHASLEEQRARIRQAENDLAGFRITAPRDGIVIDLTAQVGQHTGNAETLGRIVDPGDPIIEAEVDELFANMVQTGQVVHLSAVGRTDTLAQGRIFYVSPVLSDKSILYERANEGQDRRVRRIRIRPERPGSNGTTLTINTKVDCEIKVK